MTHKVLVSAGEAVVRLLEAYGVEVIFGIPGVHNLELYRALSRSKIRHVLARHEQGAGFMADGYARATGKPGVCFTITGPGLTNMLTPLGQAWSDSSRVFVISTALDIADSAQGRGRLHEMLDQRGAAAAVTHLHMRAYTPRDARDAIARAFMHFCSQRPRPAYLEIPIDVLTQPVHESWSPRPRPVMPVPAMDQITQAVAKLNAAQRPLILLGGGALLAGTAATTIAEKLCAPIITTTAAKGAVTANLPQFMGSILAHRHAWEMLAASDAILCAGSELAETDFWNDAIVIKHNLIRIDIDPAVLCGPHTADIALLGDAKKTLELIAKRIKKRVRSPWASFDSSEYSRGHPLRIMLAKVLQVIRETLPEPTVICSDMTQIAYAANEIFPVSRPRTWIHPVGFGTLGFALPAAIGAKIGINKTPVVVLVGDYGLQYTLNELATAVEHDLTLVILLWNNNGLGQIRDDMESKGITHFAVSPTNPDFQLLAKAYRIKATKPRHLAALARAIKSALAAQGPTLIEMTPQMVDA